MCLVWALGPSTLPERMQEPDKMFLDLEVWKKLPNLPWPAAECHLRRDFLFEYVLVCGQRAIEANAEIS